MNFMAIGVDIDGHLYTYSFHTMDEANAFVAKVEDSPADVGWEVHACIPDTLQNNFKHFLGE